jgi:uncharacterized protein GlcG (DUF336 family)
MNVAVVDSGGSLVAFQRMDGAMLASIQIAEHKGTSSRDLPARNEAVRGRYPAYASQLSARVRWNHCLSRRHPADRTGMIIGAIGSSGGTDSQDDIVSKAGAAVINQLPPSNK